MYSKGALLLSWVSMGKPYPVISDKPYPGKCTDMQMLECKGAYQNYDTHFIPVASILPDNPHCMVYYPCVHKQPPAWHEFVVFQKAQALPSFIVEIGVDLLPSLSLNYTFDGLYASCQAGDLPQVKSWILEDKMRLLEGCSRGKLFLCSDLRRPASCFKMAFCSRLYSALKREKRWLDSPACGRNAR